MFKILDTFDEYPTTKIVNSSSKNITKGVILHPRAENFIPARIICHLQRKKVLHCIRITSSPSRNKLMFFS